jgi:hypothetical protein
MIIFDENLETYWMELIKAQGYETFSIKENQPEFLIKRSWMY